MNRKHKCSIDEKHDNAYKKTISFNDSESSLEDTQKTLITKDAQRVIKVIKTFTETLI